jgi:hypothetical protein
MVHAVISVDNALTEKLVLFTFFFPDIDKIEISKLFSRNERISGPGVSALTRKNA